MGLFEDVAHACRDAGGDVVEVLSLLHDVEVVVGLDIEDTEDLVEHLTMLPCDVDDGPKAVRMFLELVEQGADLNRLRPDLENKHYFLHIVKVDISEFFKKMFRETISNSFVYIVTMFPLIPKVIVSSDCCLFKTIASIHLD